MQTKTLAIQRTMNSCLFWMDRDLAFWLRPERAKARLLWTSQTRRAALPPVRNRAASNVFVDKLHKKCTI